MLRRFSENPLRLPHLSPYVPGPDDPAIFWFNSERKDIVAEVERRVAAAHAHDRKALEVTLNEAAYHEIKRLERQRDNESRESLGYWRGLIRRIARMSDAEKRKALERTVHHMAKDVAGNFDTRVYQLSTKVIPKLLAGVMRPSKLPRELFNNGAPLISELLQVEGSIEKLHALSKKGALVYVPTHASNLDSIVLGQALEQCSLSPVIYGAGKNLFSNPIISFFMHNLGAYRVDRRIKSALYKELLKTWSCVMVERGYHSLFFPGGTRSRSGLIENHLKLGLVGSAVEAFSQNCVRGVARRVFFVPTTINYALVLEAESLVEDWLAEEGGARYIIEDDEFSRVDRWVSFFRKLAGLDAACVIRFGEPLDPFGNPVDEEGCSLTPEGHAIDPASYTLRDDQPVLDGRRDAAYTRALGELLAERFRSETVVMSTQLVAHVLFRQLVAATPGLGIFARLRLRGEVSVPREELVKQIGQTRDALRELSERGEIHLSKNLREASASELLDRALSIWNGYHSRVAARDLGVEVTAEDPTLLLYYQNRLVAFAEAIAPPEQLEAAREIGQIGVKGGLR
ncbi:MAG: hypothetical protein GXP55_18330 [Deltaproteobacteria bacterium]|nr:hypothetical protein [Deltaproteobacteria bacterium]